MQAVDDNSRLEQHTFDQNMTTLVTLVQKGDHCRASIILNEIIEHLDPCSPNIREQSQAINQVNTMLHESAMAGYAATIAAIRKTGSAATSRSNPSVSCKTCLELNKSDIAFICLDVDTSMPHIGACVPAGKFRQKKHYCQTGHC